MTGVFESEEVNDFVLVVVSVARSTVLLTAGVAALLLHMVVQSFFEPLQLVVVQ